MSARLDGRYSIRLEFCGYPERRWVVRFCGEWVGQRLSHMHAEALRDEHYYTRQRKLEGKD